MIIHHWTIIRRSRSGLFGLLRFLLKVINLKNLLVSLGYRVFNKFISIWVGVGRVAISVSRKLGLYVVRYVTSIEYKPVDIGL